VCVAYAVAASMTSTQAHISSHQCQHTLPLMRLVISCCTVEQGFSKMVVTSHPAWTADLMIVKIYVTNKCIKILEKEQSSCTPK
jgi:hypothetical protein